MGTAASADQTAKDAFNQKYGSPARTSSGRAIGNNTRTAIMQSNASSINNQDGPRPAIGQTESNSGIGPTESRTMLCDQNEPSYAIAQNETSLGPKNEPRPAIGQSEPKRLIGRAATIPEVEREMSRPARISSDQPSQAANPDRTGSQTDWSWDPFKSKSWKPDFEVPNTQRTFKRNAGVDTAAML